MIEGIRYNNENEIGEQIMSGCGTVCILFIWAVFLFPILTSTCCLILKKQKIIYKLKYFFISSLVGYSWIAAISIVMNLLNSNEAIHEKLLKVFMEFPNLTWWVETALFVLPVLVLSYLFSENKIVNFGTKK